MHLLDADKVAKRMFIGIKIIFQLEWIVRTRMNKKGSVDEIYITNEIC